MKKLVLSALVLAGLGLASCEKEQSTPAESGMANVTLHMFANYDFTNDTTYNGSYERQDETLPNGTMVEFIIDSEDLQENPVSGYNYDKLIYRAEVNNGMVTIDLPAAKDPHTVTVRYPDVTLTEKDMITSTISGNDSTVMEDVIYTTGTDNITIWDGANVIEEVYYY